MDSISYTEINTADLILVNSDTFLGKSVQWFEDFPYNHAAVAFTLTLNGTKKIYVSEADEYGIAITPIEYYVNDDKYDLLVGKLIDYNANDDMIDFLLTSSGHYFYDYGNTFFQQVIKFGYQKLCLLFKKFNKKIKCKRLWIGKKGREATKLFNCGEWAMYFYYKFFSMYKYLYEQGGTSPDELYRSVDGNKFQWYKVNKGNHEEEN